MNPPTGTEQTLKGEVNNVLEHNQVENIPRDSEAKYRFDYEWAEVVLAERLRFETLLSEISSKFVNMQAAEVDGQIKDALRIICEFLRLERGTIVEVLRDKAQLRVTHSWAAEGLEPIPIPTTLAMSGLPPEGSQKVFHGEMIMFSRVDDLPDEPMEEKIVLSRVDDLHDEPITVKQAFLRFGTKSHLTIPLLVGGSILGLLSFATLRSEHVWPEDVIQRLKFVGEIFANALARKLSEEELSRHRQHLEELVEERTVELKRINEQLQHEITERKRYGDKLQELYKQELELRQQLEAEMSRRVEFTRMLVHELKTPITPVLASTDSLLSELQDERLLSLAKNISRGANSLNSRIDELLDLARGEVGILDLNLELIDLLQLLRESAESMAPAAMNRGLSIALALPASLPQVRADMLRIQQVVQNLLTNAVKYTPKGGKVKLKASVKNALVIVEVTDTGPGLSKEERERVFEPYYRKTSDKGRLSGLGLGLAVCKRLVELHRGQIWVRSGARGGSTFGFSLPVDTASRPAVDSRQQIRLWKVLIIEDDQEIVDSIALAFEKSWPEAGLLSTSMGEEGLELVEAENPDIVILDLRLPDISGFEVLRELRLFSTVPVVVLSVRESEEDVAKALEWGADDYMTKPFRKKELLARLKAQLRKQTPPDVEMPIVCGKLRFHPATLQLAYGDREVNLTLIEGRIIQCLIKYAGKVVTHERLAEAVWGEDYEGVIVSLRSHILRLRRKIEATPGNPTLILTKAGVGYSLAKPT